MKGAERTGCSGGALRAEVRDERCLGTGRPTKGWHHPCPEALAREGDGVAMF